MAETETTKEPEIYHIPKNAIKTGRILGIRYKHWAEAIIYTGLVLYGIYLTNFVIRIKGIIMVVVGAVLFILFLRGIKGRTYFELIYYQIKNASNKKEYHLGGIDNDRKYADKAQFAGQSGLERIIYYIQNFGQELEKRYGTKENTDQPAQGSGRG